MTGLDPTKDQILEIAVLVTDPNLRAFDPKGFQRVIHCKADKLGNMSEWCLAQHAKVGPRLILTIDGPVGAYIRGSGVHGVSPEC